MRKKEGSLARSARLLSRWGQGRDPAPEAGPSPARNAPFSGRYAVAFAGNPFERAPGNWLFNVSVPAKGTGQADALGASTLYAGLMVDVTRNPPRGRVNLLFQTDDGGQLYAGGEASYTPADANGQAALAGVMLVDGGTGRYRSARGALTLTGTLDWTRGTGILAFNGHLSFQTRP